MLYHMQGEFNNGQLIIASKPMGKATELDRRIIDACMKFLGEIRTSGCLNLSVYDRFKIVPNRQKRYENGCMFDLLLSTSDRCSKLDTGLVYRSHLLINDMYYYYRTEDIWSYDCITLLLSNVARSRIPNDAD